MFSRGSSLSVSRLLWYPDTVESRLCDVFAADKKYRAAWILLKLLIILLRATNLVAQAWNAVSRVGRSDDPFANELCLHQQILI